MSKHLIILLDACRYDALKNELPKYTRNFILFPVYSGSHNTPTFYKNITNVEDFVLLTANPTPFYHKQEHKWKRVIHTKSIDPMDNLKECVELLKSEDKVFLHLIPPHTPWQGAEGESVYKALMEKLNFSMELKQEKRNFGPIGIESQVYQSVGKKVTHKYYLENLDYVLSAIFKYYAKLPKPFVITADHGELLGEDSLWGHSFRECNHHILRVVPIAVVY